MAAIVTQDRLSEIVQSVRALTENKVMVGVPDVNIGRKDGPASNAVIGYTHEHGSPLQNIPPRPFLVPGIRAATPHLERMLRRAALTALAGDKESTIKALHAIGLTAASAVRAKITAGPFLPLAPVTIAARQRRGKKSEKPLIDTGALRQSITYVLRGKWFHGKS